MQQGRYRAAIIGAGRIAVGYDAPGDKHCLTHAHAFAVSPRFECVGLYDIDLERAKQGALKWQIPVAATFEDLIDLAPDLVVIAAPDETHELYLNRVLDSASPPRVVLCEKPLTTSIGSARDIVRRYEERGIALAVNFQRRYDRCVIDLTSKLQAGDLGRVLGCGVWYSKGILHNGSHAIDFLRFVLGEAEWAIVHERRIDYAESDPTVTATMGFTDTHVQLIAGDERRYSLFEIDLLFEKGRYRFLQSGHEVEVMMAEADPIYPGYLELAIKERGRSALASALLLGVEALANALDGTGKLATTGRDALATQEICFALASALPGSRVELQVAVKEG